MTYDPGLHPTRATCPPAMHDGGGHGPIRWATDALGNRVELTPPSPAELEADEPVVVTRSQ